MSNGYKEIKPKGFDKPEDIKAADRFQKARKGSALPDPYRPRSYRERQTARKASHEPRS